MSLENRHILVFSSVYPLTQDGNHGAFVREANLKLRSTGAKFTVFAPAYEASQGYVLDGIKVYRFRYCLKPFENLVRDGAPTKIQRQPILLVTAAFYILLGTLQFFWVCMKEKPDLLQIHWPFPHGLMALPASTIFGIPMIFCFHGGELLLAKKYKFVAKILRWLLPMTRGVTANSSFTKGLIEKISDQPVTVIPYGLTVKAKPGKKNPCSQPNPTLLFVGRLDERKGLKYLLDALPLILAKYPVNLRIVGKGILETELKAQCQKLALEEAVEFLGFVTKEKLAEEYANCDIFVLPAIVDSKGDTEGLGIVMIEALAHSRPLVATAVGGIPDVILPDKTGVLVPEKNPTALANGILNLLDNPTKAAKLGYQGLIDVQERFSWKKIIPLWNNIFIKALDIK